MRKQTKKWKMKSGQKVRICDMDNAHVLKKERRKAMTCKRCGAKIEEYPCKRCGLKDKSDKGNVPLYNEEGLSNEEEESNG